VKKIVLIFILLIVSFFILLFIIKIFYKTLPPVKIYPSSATITKNSEKYNYCKTADDCEIFMYRSGCIWHIIPVNKENINKMYEEKSKWIYSGTHGDCIAYRPFAAADCINNKCVSVEIRH